MCSFFSVIWPWRFPTWYLFFLCRILFCWSLFQFKLQVEMGCVRAEDLWASGVCETVLCIVFFL
jgi:hypothetical protein